MKTKLLIFTAVLFLVGCSESQNPVSSGIVESGESNKETISGSGYTIIEGELNTGYDTIHFQPNKYKFHLYMIVSNAEMGRWELSDNLRIYYDTGIIIFGASKNEKYKILLFQ